MSEIKNRVERSAEFYEKSFLKFDFQLANYGFSTLKPYFQGALALELGPATGFMTKLLVNEFKELHIVEGSKDLLEKIPEYPNITKNHSLFEDFETEFKYDTIIMSHVLEHIFDPELVLRKIKNWLKADGIFLVAVPNAKSIHRMVAVEMGLLKSVYELNKRDLELGHYRVYDLDSLSSDLINAGFKIKSKGGYYFKPLSNGQIESNWSKEMIEGFYSVGKYFQENCAEIYAVCCRS